MNRFPLFLCFLFLLLSCNSHEYDILDETLARSEEFERHFVQTADSLKVEFESARDSSSRWAAAFELSNHYKKFSIDSAGKYIRLMESCCPDDRAMSLSTGLSQIWNLIQLGRHSEAVGLFESLSLPDDAGPDLVTQYFTTGYDCYSQNFGGQSVSPDYSAKYVRNAVLYWQRDSTSASSIDIHSRFLRREGYVNESIRLLESIRREDMTPFEYAQVEHHLAEAYKLSGDNSKSREHYINAACQDIRNNSRIYSALYKLSADLLNSNDLERANRYAERAIQDAVQCNFVVGIKRSASLGLAINDGLNQVNRRIRIIYLSFFVFAGLFSLVILSLFLRNKRLNRELKLSNVELEHKTVLLDEASRIKDGFLATTIEMAASYIKQVDEEKKSMHRLLRNEGVEALVSRLRSPSYSDSEHLNFNAKFDRMFLGVFPDFVETVNALMREDRKFLVDRRDSLNTELRILALIRLGVSESSRISRILFISKGTVYTYRCNMRMAARCRPEEFEDLVRGLGDQVP